MGKVPGGTLGGRLHRSQAHTAGYKYLLVFIYTFSDLVEAYLSRTETASIVVKKSLQEIISRFGLPVSDNSPPFVAKFSQSIALALRQISETLEKGFN